MTVGGWLMMLGSWTAVLLLNGYCVWRLTRRSGPGQKSSGSGGE